MNNKLSIYPGSLFDIFFHKIKPEFIYFPPKITIILLLATVALKLLVKSWQLRYCRLAIKTTTRLLCERREFESIEFFVLNKRHCTGLMACSARAVHVESH